MSTPQGYRASVALAPPTWLHTRSARRVRRVQLRHAVALMIMSSRRRLVTPQRLTLAFLLVVGLAFSAAAYSVARSMLRSSSEAETADALGSAEDAMVLAFEQVRKEMMALGALHYSSEEVTRPEFTSFVVQDEMLRNGVIAIEWAPLIRPHQRTEFELDLGQFMHGLGPSSPSVAVHPATTNDQALPVDFVEPLTGNEPALGYDLLSEPIRRAAAESARDSGLITATKAISLVQRQPPDDAGILLFKPIYGTGDTPATVDDRREAFIGAYVAVYALDDLFETLRQESPTDFWVSEEAGDSIPEDGAQPSDRLLYGSDDLSSQPNTRSATIDFFDRTWAVGVAQVPVAYEALPWLALLLALTVVGLSLLYLANLYKVRDQAEAKSRILAKSESNLSRSNQDLRDFVYGVSHDLQAPLRHVSGSLDLLVEDLPEPAMDEEVSTSISHMQTAVDSMAAQLKGLLEYSRLDSVATSGVQVDLNEVLADALILLSAEIEQLGAEVTVRELPRVTGNREALTSLFSNLVKNSLDYRDPSRTPSIEILQTEPTQSHVVILVIDNGLGIKPAFRVEVFKMFRHFGTRQGGDGSGMGLAICRRVVDRHGGHIYVADPPTTGGNTMRIELPKAGAG